MIPDTDPIFRALADPSRRQIQGIRQGGGPIIDGLKTYLETGTPLEFPRK